MEGHWNGTPETLKDDFVSFSLPPIGFETVIFPKWSVKGCGGGGVYNFRPECLGLSYNERNNLDSPGLGLRAEQQAPEKAVWLMK